MHLYAQTSSSSFSLTIIPATEKYGEMIAGQYSKDWNIRLLSSGYSKGNISIGILKDTLCNGQLYQAVEIQFNGKLYDTLLYRQDGRKVYRLSSSDGVENLLFDFGLQIGDTFVLSSGETLYVSDIEETDVNYQRKRIELRDKAGAEVRDVWLESVGSLFTGILSLTDLDEVLKPRLIYSRQVDSYPDFYFELNEDLYKNVFLNGLDFCNSEETSEDDNVNISFIGDTLCFSGIMPLNACNYGLECYIREKAIILEMSDLHHGPEPENMVDRVVEIRIPGFQVGTYEVSYIPWAINDTMNLGTIQCLGTQHISVASGDIKQLFFETATQTIHCSSPEARSFEVYTLDGMRVGESIFQNGETVVKVDKIPATYLYVITYPDGRRTSGKVVVK